MTNVYDAVGRRLALRDPRDNRTSFAYDLAGNETLVKDPLGNRTTSVYDAANRKIKRVDARGNRTTFVYDAAGRLTQRRYPDGTQVTQVYDVIGNRTLLADATGRYTAVFDSLDRLSSRTNPAGKRITYVYDGIGQRKRFSDPDAGLVTTVYDAASQLTQVTNAQALRTTFGYDAAGRRTVKKLANASRASMTWDNADRLTRLVNIKSSRVTISAFSYRYDSTNRRSGVTESSGDRVTWTYDATYQLTHEKRSGINSYDVTHIYDPAGNRTVKIDSGARTTATYDAANRLINSIDGTGRTTFTFDASGNQTRQTTPSGQVTTSVWDYENLNKTVILPSLSRVTLVYNGDKLRVEKDTATSTAKFVYDGQNIVFETAGTNATQAVYTLEPAEFGKLIAQRQLVAGSWVPVYYAFDGLGSADSLTDSGQVITDTYTYFAFGVLKANTGTTSNRFTWVGELGYVRDTETGEYQLHVRPHLPDRARFKSKDPIGVKAGPNSFIYTHNDPINRVDPSGTDDAITRINSSVQNILADLPPEEGPAITADPQIDLSAPVDLTAGPRAKRAKILAIIGDWEKEKTFKASAVDKLVENGLAAQMASLQTTNGGTVIRRYVKIPRDDGGVDTLILRSVWHWLEDFHYEIEALKHGVTPSSAMAAQEARDEERHLRYMAVHRGVMKAQAGMFTLLTGPIGVALGIDLIYTGGYRDVATGKDNETIAATIVATKIEEVFGVEEQTARKIGRVVNVILMFGDGALGTSWEGASSYQLRVTNEPPPEFMSGPASNVEVLLPEGMVVSEGVAPNSPQAGRMHTEPVELTSGSGRDFVVPGRSKPELFSARLMDESKTLQVTWTESLGQGTLVNRLAKAQELAGGPGSFTRITGQASDNLRALIKSGQFNTREAAAALGKRLGGTWDVEVVPRPKSNPPTWDVNATRIGD